MELICDGSGAAVYYTFKGNKFLLCETLVGHVHCECGEPLIGGAEGDHCKDCNKRNTGMSLHHRKPHLESREHVSGVSSRLQKNLKSSFSD